MKLLLTRTIKAPDHTEGRLTIDGLFFAYTLERPADGKNIPNRSAINEGTYSLKKRWSHHLGMDVIGVCDVAGRSDIEMHPANTVNELQGCISVGMAFMPNGFLSQSRVAFNALLQQFQEPSTITIESAVQDSPMPQGSEKTEA